VRWSWEGAANCSSLGSVITVDPLVGIRGALLGSAVVVSAARAEGGVEAFPSQSCRALTLLSASEVPLHIALVQLPFERLSEAPLPLPQAPALNPHTLWMKHATAPYTDIPCQRTPYEEIEGPSGTASTLNTVGATSRLGTARHDQCPARYRSLGPARESANPLRPRRSSRQRLITTNGGTVSRRATLLGTLGGACCQRSGLGRRRWPGRCVGPAKL
jgi:hypothetical protein